MFPGSDPGERHSCCTCWQQVCEGQNLLECKSLFATPNGQKSKQEYLPSLLSMVLHKIQGTRFAVPVAFCTVQQCGFFHETGFRVNGLDIILLGNQFSGFPLYFPIGIWTQTYRNPTSFFFQNVFTQTLATLGSFLPFFSDFWDFKARCHFGQILARNCGPSPRFTNRVQSAFY